MTDVWMDPQPDHFIIRPMTQEEKTQGGVVIPETARKLLDEGIIVEVADNLKHKRKAGDKVIYTRYSGSWIRLTDAGAGAYGEARDFLVLHDKESNVTLRTGPRSTEAPASGWPR